MAGEPGKDGDNNKGGGDGAATFDDVEATARRMGWKPESEFRGDAGKWKPAKEFVDEAMANYPVLINRYRVLDERAARTQRDLDKANDQLVDIGKAVGEMRDFHQQSLKAAEVRAYNQARADIEEEIRQATKDADPVKAEQAMERLRNLDKDRPKEEPEKKPAAAGDASDKSAAAGGGDTKPAKLAPEVEEWSKDNPWYFTDPLANQMAVSIHLDLLQRRKDLSLKDNLAEVSKEIRKRFPEHFHDEPPRRKANEQNGAGGDDDGDGDDRRGAPSVTESTAGSPPAGGPRGGRKRTYNDLPADARAACDRFTKTMIKGPDGKMVPMMTREQYLEQYPWEG